MKNYDVLIVGGGIMAASVAYHLREQGYPGSIGIFEKDAMYEYSSTPRSEGGIRQTFSTEINIKMSQYSFNMYEKFEQEMALDGDETLIDFKKNGYLYLLNEMSLPIFEDILKIHRKLNVKSEYWTPAELKERYPDFCVEDLAGAVFDPDAGNADPYSVLQAYNRHNKRRDVDYMYEEVDTILREGDRVTGVRLANGEVYHANIVVNAAGAWSGELSDKLALPIPVKPLRRQLYTIDMTERFSQTIPFTFDPTGLHFRTEGDRYVVGWAREDAYGYNFKLNRSFFEEEIWPVLASRSPLFEQLKMERGWAGLYDYNTADQNAVIGEHPELTGYYIITGFSGHGFQHAPAAGNGLAELIHYGKYETIDLHPLRVERFKEKDLVLETAVY